MRSFVDAVPLYDDQNPCYCPVDAFTFIQTLRCRPLSNGSNEHELRASFTSRLLQKSVDEEFLDVLRADRDHSVSRFDYSLSSTVESAYTISPRKRDVGYVQTPSTSLFISNRPMSFNHPGPGPAKRKRRDESLDNITFSDLMGRSKRGRSGDVVNHDSFQLSGKADKIRYSCADYSFSPITRVLSSTASASQDTGHLVERVQELEVELYGPTIGPETPNNLAGLSEYLDLLLPGIRLRERLEDVEGLSHQTIVDILAVHGHLSDRILDIFRTSEIVSLDLSASIADQSGLNLAGRDLLKVFRKPNSFVFLSFITIDNVAISDFGLTHIHHLPRLSVLSLCNTGLGNEAISHLLSLKWSLKELYIDSNPRIDDDAISPLLLLSKLKYLSIVETSIGIIGLRRLAVKIDKTGRCLYIDAPDTCYGYFADLDKCYTVDLRPPLITDPNACDHLTVEALEWNLLQHAKSNPDISVTGSKAKMATRLQEILTTRKSDLLVISLLSEGGSRRQEEDAD